MVGRSVLYASFVCLLLTAMPARAEIKWLTLEEGRSRAAAEKISDVFIPVRVSLKKRLTEEEAALGNRYNFRNDCLLLFLDHKGNIIKGPGEKELRFMRVIEPEQFKQYLNMVEEVYRPHKGQLLP